MRTLLWLHNQNKRSYLYILFLMCWFCSSLLYGQKNRFVDCYTSKHGLAQNSVNDIAKDSLGFVWVATNDGISRFDGYSFQNYKVSSSTFDCGLNNQFLQILTDKQGNIWTRNTLGQVFMFNVPNGIFSIYPDPQENRGDNYLFVNKVDLLRNGELWLLGSEKGAICVEYKGHEYVSSSYFIGESHAVVNSVFVDNANVLWALTDKGIYRRNDKNSFETMYSGVCVYDCIEINNDLLFSCDNGVLLKYDFVKNSFTKHSVEDQVNLRYLYSLGKSNVLALSDHAYYEVELPSCQNRKLPYTNNMTMLSSFEDDNGNIWVRNEKTVQKIQSAEVAETPNTHRDHKKGYGVVDENESLIVLSDFGDCVAVQNLQPILSDTVGVLWVADKNNGLKKYVDNSTQFRFVNCNSLTKSDVGEISAITCDEKGQLWVSTKNDCLMIFDKNANFVTFVNSNGLFSSSKCHFPSVSSLCEGKNGVIWASHGKTILKILPNKDLKRFTEGPDTPNDMKVNDMLEDESGRLWISTEVDGLHMLSFSKETYKFDNRRTGLKGCYPPTVIQTKCLMTDKTGNIWLGSNDGLTVFSPDFPDLKYLKFFYYNPENSNMTSCDVSDLYQDADGAIWIASYGGGLMKTDSFELGETPVFKTFNKENKKLSSDLISSINEDKKGNLWLVSDRSLIKFEKKEGLYTFMQLDDEIKKGDFGRFFIQTKLGEIALASTDGLYLMNPNEMESFVYSPQIVFSRFLLFNKGTKSSENNVVNCDINTNHSIVLSHNQSFFSIEFAALDYRNTDFIEYAIKLDGFDEDWNYVGKQRLATYTNLPHGTYEFHVKSTNGEGQWCDNERVLTIEIKPAFWQTNLAWFLYVVLFAALVYGAVYAYLKFYKMRSDMQFEQEMSNMKMQFFTDVSHELRTPLSLISAPVENLLENGNLKTKEKEQLEIVKTNTDRMMRMLNQILDFRKLQSNKMRLRVEQTVLADLVNKCCDNFREMAVKRNIAFDVFNHIDNAMCWLDQDKIDTVMFNLLSNAFKFTPEGKSISVSLDRDEDNYSISVEDQGCGMPQSKTHLIFERFKTLQAKSLTNQTGTGIGLALVKEIIDLHRGAILVETEEGVGSKFCVKLKIGKEHFGTETDIIEAVEKEYTDNTIVQSDKETTILIVEDNDDLRKFIVSILCDDYNIVEADNGQIAYEMAVDKCPDFILTDIMMPVMDGIELVRRIRSNDKISHVPVVLLTAKTDMQSKLECLKIGANDYITKPFSVAFLQTRIENILLERKKWQERFRIQLLGGVSESHSSDVYVADKTDLDDQEVSVVSSPNSADQKFVKELMKIVEDNMENEDLSPDILAKNMEMSRHNLTSKIKSLLGLTPVELIREVRLTKAASLIDSGELNMTQITYSIGMTDSRYFSRCFKQKYGMTPTEYKNRNLT